ncbi:MAG TPA: SRPBCC family protein [Casimicrobiaceae bacterium]|jgi:hypothetical protein
MDAVRRGAATPRGAARLLAGLRPWLLGVALAMPWMPAAFAQDSRDIAVAVHRDGEEVVVDVDFLVAATPQEAWNVLTDYDHMSQFVADLTSSRILRRDGDRLEVAQQGRFRFGFFELKIENVRAIELVPMREIRSQLVSGDMKASAFTTRVAVEGNATRITNHGRFTPDRWIPPVIGPAVMQAQTRKQFAEIRAEILRRKAAAAKHA